MNFLDDIFRYNSIHNMYTEYLKRKPSIEELEKWYHSKYRIKDIHTIICLSKEYRNIYKLKDYEKYYNWPQAQYFVNIKHNIVYIPIAKNGCTSIKNYFFELNSDQVSKDYKNLIYEKHRIHSLTDFHITNNMFCDFTPKEILDITARNPLYIIILRDPLERIISSFWDKFVVNINCKFTNQNVKKQIHDYFKNKGKIEKEITFEDFINFLSTNEPLSYNTHWIPQTFYFRNIKNKVIFELNKLKNFSDFMRDITGKSLSMSTLNANPVIEDNEKHYKTTVKVLSTLNYRPNNKSFINRDLLIKIKNIYKEDYCLINNIYKNNAKSRSVI